jgi:hypothetical protein
LVVIHGGKSGEAEKVDSPEDSDAKAKAVASKSAKRAK